MQQDQQYERISVHVPNVGRQRGPEDEEWRVQVLMVTNYYPPEKRNMTMHDFCMIEWDEDLDLLTDIYHNLKDAIGLAPLKDVAIAAVKRRRHLDKVNVRAMYTIERDHKRHKIDFMCPRRGTRSNPIIIE